MGTHESSVNYRNLIRDLAAMYPQDVAEVVLIELIANSLDAGANRIDINFDPSIRSLVIRDNGRGMTAAEFDQYHDFAAGLKTRGAGIGFAGVGAKISFNIAEKVVTHTRGKGFRGGSNWHFIAKGKLIWADMKPEHFGAHGTKVEVYFRADTKVAFSSSENLIRLIRRWYLPLLDTEFLALYDHLGYYSKKLRFVVNGEVVEPFSLADVFNLDKKNTRKFNPKSRDKDIGYGVFGLAASEYPLSPDVSGVLLCTRGKVIKSEMFSQFPGIQGPRIFGVVEVPDFVKYLTTPKTDFVRAGRHRELERLYSPIRQEFKAWLVELGVQQVESDEHDEGAKLERELKKIVNDIPELGDFFGFRTRTNVLLKSSSGSENATPQNGAQPTLPDGTGFHGRGEAPVDVGDGEESVLVKDEEKGTAKATPISRTSRRGPKITFVKAADRSELGWVEGNTVVINSAHPCYLKHQTNPSAKRLHSFYAIAATVQRFLGTNPGASDLTFIDRMMAAWGKK